MAYFFVSTATLLLIRVIYSGAGATVMVDCVGVRAGFRIQSKLGRAKKMSKTLQEELGPHH
jgi:hypothetical protein